MTDVKKSSIMCCHHIHIILKLKQQQTKITLDIDKSIILLPLYRRTVDDNSRKKKKIREEKKKEEEEDRRRKKDFFLSYLLSLSFLFSSYII